MNRSSRVEWLPGTPAAAAAFERVRESMSCYRGLPRETLPEGSEALLVWNGDEPVARASLAMTSALHGVDGLCGLIGHFEAADAESARRVLAEGCSRLASRGALRVLGPMNGSTWGRYRLALPGHDGTAQPVPFLGEPANPPDYAAWFESAGFTVAAHYESRLDDAPHEPAADADALAARIAEAGIRIRSLDATRFADEARLLHTLSLEAFAGNPYYTPLDWEPFYAQYEPLQRLLQPELVLFAETAAGETVAFQFAYLDPLAQALAAPARAIVKTVATRPAARGLGLAGHMLDLLRARAVARGATSVIHALMHVNNFSMKMSSRHRSHVFRRYALYEWRP